MPSKPERHLSLVPEPEPRPESFWGEYWPLAAILLLFAAALLFLALTPPERSPGGYPSPSECVYSDC